MGGSPCCLAAWAVALLVWRAGRVEERRAAGLARPAAGPAAEQPGRP
ncbi:hypothetical protein [Streptomyces sp. SudanB182_2057]